MSVLQAITDQKLATWYLVSYAADAEDLGRAVALVWYSQELWAALGESAEDLLAEARRKARALAGLTDDPSELARLVRLEAL